MGGSLVRNLVFAVVASVGPGACSWFDDPSPEQASVTVTGEAGEMVQILLSKQFITGIDANNITQVEIFQGDTLFRALPWDTTVSISVEQRFFVRSIDADSMDHQQRMQVRIDGELEYDRQDISSGIFQFLFTFNQPITSVIEVI